MDDNVLTTLNIDNPVSTPLTVINVDDVSANRADQVRTVPAELDDPYISFWSSSIAAITSAVKRKRYMTAGNPSSPNNCPQKQRRLNIPDDTTPADEVNASNQEGENQQVATANASSTSVPKEEDVFGHNRYPDSRQPSVPLPDNGGAQLIDGCYETVLYCAYKILQEICGAHRRMQPGIHFGKSRLGSHRSAVQYTTHCKSVNLPL